VRTDDLDYHLPPELIAQTPAERRDAARLLVVRLASDTIEHRTVAELPQLLSPGDLLVLNDTKVMPAKFAAVRAATGGKVEGLFLETRNDATWHLLLKSGGRPRKGETITLQPGHDLILLEQLPGGSWIAEKRSPLSTADLLDAVGSMPLPPYIERQLKQAGGLDSLDRQRYQTIYARNPGAVAAPTAGLHFTDGLLQQLNSRGIDRTTVTLHVGMGTFQPVRAATLEEHDMHTERFSVPAETLGKLRAARTEHRRIIPVGTTSVRALESLPADLPTGDYTGETKLLIQPGFRFRFTDGLMTNFHLPRSTLLALVAALTGLDRLKRIYQTAIDHRYRFYSYGDAMLILPE
jgi:S-adenosylmethionine:tRNA ribosyltransferase-isomerase